MKHLNKSTKSRTLKDAALASSNSYCWMNVINSRNKEDKTMFSTGSCNILNLVHGSYPQSNSEFQPMSASAFGSQSNNYLSNDQDISSQYTGHVLRELSKENLSVFHKKLMSVKNGSEKPIKSRELSKNFRSENSPHKNKKLKSKNIVL